MQKFISETAKMTRWQDWGPGKITLLCSLCFYIAAAYQIPFAQFLLPFVLFLIFASAQAALGFMINNWGDRQLDQQQNKPNPFTKLSLKTSLYWLIGLSLLAVLSALPFIQTGLFTLLWGLYLFFMLAYSLKPLRLKTRGFFGLLVSFSAQWSLPVLLAFAVLEKFGKADMWVFALVLTISGACLEVSHQRYDRERDSQSNARTFGSSLSSKKIDKIYAFAVLLDKIAVMAVSILVMRSLLTFKTWWAITLFAGTGLVTLLLFFLSLPASIKACIGGPVQDPYYEIRRTPAKLFHETVPNLLLPSVLILSLSFKEWFYIPLLLLFFFWRIVLGKVDFPSAISDLLKIGKVK